MYDDNFNFHKKKKKLIQRIIITTTNIHHIYNNYNWQQQYENGKQKISI